ncbi:MAG TPA: hypothetical protein VFO60_00970 [Candidatus Dormibacteraeota bacterium]|nr:hypothetical protein [Candidatus Dormibacteraeota bacterium]
MAEKLLPRKHAWEFISPAPAREIFASMEQMCGTPPYRFEVTGPGAARVVETERKNLFGAWAQLGRRDADGNPALEAGGAPAWRRPVEWVTATVEPFRGGSRVRMEASGGRFVAARAVQLIELVTRGSADRRTVYRDRSVPPGPVSLVASWAGMLYRVYLEPSHGAARGPGVHTASHLVAVAGDAAFTRVRLEDGTEGYIETDQIVASPVEATREAQVRTAGEPV